MNWFKQVIERILDCVRLLLFKKPVSLARGSLPRVLHVSYNSTRKTIIIGDVHGCLDEFTELLQKCRYDANCDIVLVGDLVNKGPFSAEVVKYARHLNVLAVRGNHEEALLSRVDDGAQKLKGTKYEYINKLSREDIHWLKELPYSISLPHLNALVVHAGRIPGIPLEKQSTLDLVTMRNLIPLDNGCYKASKKTKKGQAWASLWNDPKIHVYFGHDAKRGLQLYPHATGLDTGACYGRQLTAIILPSKEIVQVQSKKVYQAN